MTPELTGHFWYRESTQEWVFEVEFQIEGYVTSNTRFAGKTKKDALRFFAQDFVEYFTKDLEHLEQSGFVGA